MSLKAQGLEDSGSPKIMINFPSTIACSVRRNAAAFGMLIAPYKCPGIIAPSRGRDSGGL